MRVAARRLTAYTILFWWEWGAGTISINAIILIMKMIVVTEQTILWSITYLDVAALVQNHGAVSIADLLLATVPTILTSVAAATTVSVHTGRYTNI